MNFFRPNFWSQTRPRLFALMLLVALPALGVQMLGAWSDLQQNLSDRKAEVAHVAAHAQGDFANLVEKSRTVFTDLVRVNGMRSPDNCTQIYNALRFAYERLAPEATNLGLADAQGNLYCAVNPVQGDSNIAGRPYFQDTLQTLDMAVGEYTLNSLTGAPNITVAYPVLSFDGRLQTVIVATFGTHWLDAWQSEVSLPADAALTLLTPTGEVLQRWADGKVQPEGIVFPSGWFASLASQAEVVESPDLDGVRRLNSLLPLGIESQTGAYLHLGYPVAEIYTKAYQALWWKLALLGISFLGAMLLAWWGSERWFLRPLNQLMGAVAQVQAGDLSVRSAAPTERSRGLGELIQLAQSFDRMAEALQQREAERQQSEARFQAVYENAAIGISLVAPDRQVLGVNPTLLQMSGYSEAEMKELRGLGITYPEDLEVGQAEFGEVLAGKRPSYQVEKRYVHKNGHIHWMRQTVSPVRDPDGKLLYLVAIAEDIDQQKRAVEELRESEARFRAMFDSAAVGVAVMTLDRRIVQVNQTATRLTGYTTEEMNTINPSMLAIEEDRYIDRELFIELIQGQRDQYTAEKRYMRKDGSIFWGRVNFSAVRGADGKPVYTIGLIEDISEEKEAQNRIAESEARFRTLYDHAEMGIVLVDLGKDGSQPLDNTRFQQLVASQRFNPAMLRMFSYSEEEFLRTEIIGLIYPDDRSLDTEQFRQLLAGKIDGFRSEKRFVRKDGSVFWGRLTDSLVRAADGTPRMVIGIIEDVNDEHLMLAKLQESEARFRTMFNTAAVGIGIMGLDRTVMDANPALCQMYGYAQDELIGQSSFLVGHPDEFSRATQQLQGLLDGQYDSFSDERRYIHKSGEVRWADITISLVRDDHAKPLYLVGIFSDTTERKQAQDTLRESEARFRAMFDNAAVGVLVVMPGRIAQINQTAERLLGYTAEEIEQVTPTTLALDEDRPIGSDLFQELAQGKRNHYTVEKRYTRKDGTIFWGRANFGAVRDVDGGLQYNIVMIEDITEERRSAEKLAAQEALFRRDLEERIAERTAELHQANALLQQKAAQDAVIAERTRLARDLHDAVTQTLFSTTLIADVLPDIWNMNPDEGKRRLEEVRQLTRGALAEMRTLLVELRPNALIEIPLPTLLRQLTEAMIGRSRINITLGVEGDSMRKLPPEVQVGLYRLAQEALNNIVKHAKASQAIITLRLGENVRGERVRGEQVRGEQVRLTVVDNGIGFDPSMVTVDHLGLQIMRERAEAIGAKLSIYSEPGEGTQISVIW